jgi:hypothetical protein
MKKAFKFLAALCALTLLVSACSFSVSTANFADAYTAADPDGAARYGNF